MVIRWPKIAPAMNSGKKLTMNPPSAGMKICVYVASRGAPESTAASKAASGATTTTEWPRYAKKMRNASDRKMPIRARAMVSPLRAGC